MSFDFKGVQYRGTFYPTATAVVLAVVNGKENYLKIDGIADDFCYLEKTGDALKKFDAHAVGDMSGYSMQDEDVNRATIASANQHTGSEGALSAAKLKETNAGKGVKAQAVKTKRSTSKKSSSGAAPKNKKHKS